MAKRTHIPVRLILGERTPQTIRVIDLNRQKDISLCVPASLIGPVLRAHVGDRISCALFVRDEAGSVRVGRKWKKYGRHHARLLRQPAVLTVRQIADQQEPGGAVTPACLSDALQRASGHGQLAGREP